MSSDKNPDSVPPGSLRDDNPKDCFGQPK